MIKKILAAAVSTIVVCAGLPLTAAAAPDTTTPKLPFVLEKPTGAALQWLEGDDSFNTMKVVYSMGDSMCQWMTEESDSNSHEAMLEKLLKDYGLSELFVNAQVDWAIDDPVNGWHYTAYWDGETYTDEDGIKRWPGFGYDKDQQYRTGEWDILETLVYPQTVNELWIFRGREIYDLDQLPEDVTREAAIEANLWFDGNDLIPGLKNQLKPDQYTLVETNPETHEKSILIDWKQHTAYVRVRWAITYCKEDAPSRFVVFSDWSDTAAAGKDVEEFVPFTKETLAPPVISDLRYYEDEFNGYPQIACTLTVPEEVNKKMSQVVARGGNMWVEWEARIPGGEWVGLQGGSDVTAGEQVIALQNLAEKIISQNKEKGVSTPEVVIAANSPVELRARYWCNQYDSYQGEEIGEFYTDYSQVLTFATQEMSHTETSVVESSVVEDVSKSENSTPQKTEEEPKCKLCKNCPAPLGICIWIWIAIIVAVIVIVVVVIILVKKNKKNKKEQK